MKDNTKCFKISDTDINKIRVSDNKLYKKEHNSYKYYVFYERDDDYIPLRIILKDVVGYYNDYKDNSKDDAKYTAKKMNFRISDDDDLLIKFYEIFEHIEEKLGIALNKFVQGSKGEEYIKTIVSDETCFKSKDNKTNIIPNENTKHTCRVLLKIQSVYYSMKDNDADIKHYQVLLEQCGYRPFSNNVFFHKDLEFTVTEPDSESDEEINENTVFDG